MTVSGDFSLILELTKKGWNFEYATPSKKTPAYAPEGAKTWFFHRQNKKGGINTAYLNALCQADSLTERVQVGSVYPTFFERALSS